MTFDNSKTIISIRLRGFIATTVFLIYIVLIYVGRVVRFPIAGIQEIPATIVLTSLYTIIIFLPLLLRKMYIYFSDDGDEIILKYFYAGMITGRKNSIVINKRTFAGYSLKRGALRLNTKLVLSQRVKHGFAKYPPVSLSSLKKKEREKLLMCLNRYTQQG